MIIDIHAHLAYGGIFPKYFLDGTVEGLVSNSSLTGSPDAIRSFVNAMIGKALNDKLCINLKKQMEEADIDKTVLLIADFGYGREDEGMTIDEIYKVHREILLDSPDRFIVFAGIDPRRGHEGIELFSRGIAEYGFKGLKLYPPCGFSLKEECILPYLELCRRYGIPVLTHTGPSLGNMYNEHDYIESIYRLASEFSDVVFIAAHATYSDFDRNVELALKMDNVYLDISAFQNELSQRSLLQKLTILGQRIPEKILFGTDWPLYILSGKQKRWVDFIVESGAFGEAALEKLLYKNSAAILNLDAAY